MPLGMAQTSNLSLHLCLWYFQLFTISMCTEFKRTFLNSRGFSFFSRLSAAQPPYFFTFHIQELLPQGKRASYIRKKKGIWDISTCVPCKLLISLYKDEYAILAICIVRACWGRERVWKKGGNNSYRINSHITISRKIAMYWNGWRERNKKLGQIILLTEWRSQKTPY